MKIAAVVIGALGVGLRLSRAEDCETFECFNDSTCANSTADFSEHPTNADGTPLPFHTELARDGKHCQCQPGWTGLRCAREYTSCADTEHKCYNGGKCIPGIEDAYGNEQMFCDCADATDERGNSYVGKYCELVETNVCDEDGSVFCVNGGECKNRYMDHPEAPCICSVQHEGPHCEFDKGTVPDCDLECENGGYCRLGMKIYADAEDYLMDIFATHTGYMYCECPQGWHGERCQIESETCGEYHCFHGGECVTGETGDVMKQTCDCTRAVGVDGQLYGGQHCQYEASDYCGDGDGENGQMFCVNGGICNADGSHLACDCPDGFHGPICEFADDSGPDAFCALDCRNGGQCRAGLKDTSFLAKFGLDVAQYNDQHENFEHCVCPEGWVGVRCEHEVEVCGDGEHVCFHGSKCVKDGSKDVCDCEPGFDGLDMLAGTFCQHKSTVICSATAEAELRKDSFSFCVNGGTCLPDGDGCTCPNEWEGPHCEFREGTQPPPPGTPEPTTAPTSPNDTPEPTTAPTTQNDTPGPTTAPTSHTGTPQPTIASLAPSSDSDSGESLQPSATLSPSLQGPPTAVPNDTSEPTTPAPTQSSSNGDGRPLQPSATVSPTLRGPSSPPSAPTEDSEAPTGSPTSSCSHRFSLWSLMLPVVSMVISGFLLVG